MDYHIGYLKEKILNNDNNESKSMFIKIIGFSVFACLIDFLLLIIVSKIFFGKMVIDINKVKSLLRVILVFSVPALVSYILMPILFFHRDKQRFNILYGFKFIKTIKSVIVKIVLAVALFVIFLELYKKYSLNKANIIMISFIFVAISEEIYIRGILYNIMNIKYKKWFSVIATSLVFVFIMHSGSDIGSNVFVRLPLSLILSGLYIFTGDIYSSIMFHLIYDVFLTVI